MNKEKYYPISKFGGYTDIDSTVLFYQRINSLLEDDFIVLDVGCGRGYAISDLPIRRELKNLTGKCKRVIGIDVDEQAKDNPFIEEFYLINANNTWPIPSESINLVVCDYVLEHMETPETLFSEVGRVLKKNGFYCLRTTNKFGYVGLLSKIIPAKYHRNVLSKIMPSRKDIDIFPTHYKCNTIKKIKKQMQLQNFDYFVFSHEDEPGYLDFSRLLYSLGVIYQKASPSFIRHLIIAFGKKQ